MENERKKIKTEEEGHGEDRITSLPDPILVDIISLLETRDAVRTSALSTKWRHHWTFVRNLVFDLRDMYPETAGLLTSIFFINKLLVFQDKPPKIDKFSFTCGHAQWGIVSDFFDAWIRAVLGGGVQELHIDVPACLKLPPAFFTSETLVDLRLGGDGGYYARVALEQIPKDVHFPNLKRLYVRVHTPTDDFTRRFFNGCPVLESLAIDVVLDWYQVHTFNISAETLKELKIVLTAHYFGSSKHRIMIDAPVLEKLSIQDNLLSCYSLRNSPSLVKACIDVGQSFRASFRIDDCSDFLYELLKGVSEARSLQLSDHTMRAIGKASNSGLCVFPNLTRVELGCTIWSRLVDLLARMPLLESLKLVLNNECVRPRKTYEVPGEAMSDHEKADCFLSHLKLIEIDGFRGREDQQQLMKYFLKNAKVLNKMVIICQNLAPEELRKLKIKTGKFPKGSETSQIEISAPS